MAARSLLAALVVGTAGIFAATHPVIAAERPNILLIMGDDAGIDCFGCYGSDRAKNLTPHIDALALSGTRFERCYSTPLCGPSRCVLMTGRYGFRTGGLTNQTSRNCQVTAEPSLAKILKSAGYVTGMAGKWRQMSDSPGDWGFDEYLTDPTASGWFWQKSYTKNGEQVTTEEEIYYPDVASQFAADFIRRHKDEPFCFYLSEHLVHGPILRTPDSRPALAMHFVIVPLAMISGALPVGAFEVTLNVLYHSFARSGSPPNMGFLLALGYRVIQILIGSIGLGYWLTGKREVRDLIHKAEDLPAKAQ